VSGGAVHSPRVVAGASLVHSVGRRSRRLLRARAVPSRIVHCAHHKVGTVWFGNVLSALSSHYGLRFVHCRDGVEPPRADVYLFPNARWYGHWKPSLGTFRGTHMVRDPRDVVVSGFRYHLWSDEPWVTAPRVEYGGLSYRDHLRSLEPGDGLMAELERACATTVREMAAWDYDQPEILELRYEDLITDEVAGFTSVFEHYGLRGAAAEQGLRFVERSSFRAVSGRAVGETASRSHLRSGRPGDWREHFEDRHVERMKELAGQAIIDLGYERDPGWGR
jgi:hypothetical protein